MDEGKRDVTLSQSHLIKFALGQPSVSLSKVWTIRNFCKPIYVAYVRSECILFVLCLQIMLFNEAVMEM
jgi:hypothetical protein